MPSKDYKDALNDIRLSSEFCAKMEEKLSREPFGDDEYEEVENHVEVIEHKSFKRYIAAAAVIAVIGAVGSGGYMRIKKDFSSVKQYGIDPDAEEETTSAKNGSTIFDFPFASVDIKKTTFTFNSVYSSSLPTTPSDEMAEQIIDLFSQVDWSNKTSVSYDFDSQDIDHSDPSVVNVTPSLYTSYGKETISFSCDNNNEYSYVAIYSNGTIQVTETAPFSEASEYNEKLFYYQMTEEQFKELKKIIVGNDGSTLVNIAGIKADLTGMNYSLPEKDGVISEYEAAILARLIGSEGWTLMSDGYERTDEKPVSISLSADQPECRVDFYKNDIAFVTKTDPESNKLTERAYLTGGEIYTQIFDMLSNDCKLDCPVDISDMQDTTLEIMENGNITYYHLGKDGLAECQKILNDSEWYYVHTPYLSYFYNTEHIEIKGSDSYLCIYADGKVSCEPTMSDIDNSYRLDNYEKLKAAISAVSDKTPMDNKEYALKELNRCLAGDKVTINASHSTSGKEETYTVSSAELRKIFEDAEWEEPKTFTLPGTQAILTDDAAEHYISIGKGGLEWGKNPDDITFYHIFNNTGWVITISSHGCLSTQSAYLNCTDPEKLADRLAELCKESKE